MEFECISLTLSHRFGNRSFHSQFTSSTSLFYPHISNNIRQHNSIRYSIHARTVDALQSKRNRWMRLYITCRFSINAKISFCLSSLNQCSEKVIDCTIEESKLKSQQVQTTLFLPQYSDQICA